jgi:hypothetical protein
MQPVRSTVAPFGVEKTGPDRTFKHYAYPAPHAHAQSHNVLPTYGPPQPYLYHDRQLPTVPPQFPNFAHPQQSLGLYGVYVKPEGRTGMYGAFQQNTEAEAFSLYHRQPATASSMYVIYLGSAYAHRAGPTPFSRIPYTQ